MPERPPASSPPPVRADGDAAPAPGTPVAGEADAPGVAWHAALASAAVVGCQVFLPRLFSIVLWYHLGFLAVSLAMLGLALGGHLVRRRVGRTGRPGGGFDRRRLAALAALALALVPAVVVRLPVDPAALLESPAAAAWLALLVVAVAVPFVLLGTWLCSALEVGRRRLGVVWGASFLGGAAGAALCLGAMQLFGLRAAVPTLAALSLAAALGRRPQPAAWLALVALTAWLAAPGALLPLLGRKHFPVIRPEQVLAEASDATSHVVFYDNVDHHGIWALAPETDEPPPPSVAAAIDAWAITFITQRDGPDEFPDHLRHHPASLAYVDAPPGFSALVIGAGGGWDVLGALAAGAGHVTAVEINPHIVEAVQGRWAAYSGHLYDDPRVEVHVAEGRHFTERDERRYDRIVLAGVDTFAATQAGAFALAENDLYTVEAFRLWLSRLEPGGRLFLTRWWFEPPRQTLRLALTIARVLRERGVDTPARRLFVAQLGNSLTLVKAGGDFTAEETRRLERAATARGARTVHTPASPWQRGRGDDPRLVAALDAPDPRAFARDYPYRVDPTTDDRPFFFEYGRLSTLFRSEGNWIHDRLGGQEVLVTCLVLLLLLSWPLLAAARAPPAGAGRPRTRLASRRLPFLLLGFGYLFVELPLMQRLTLLLGHPVYAVAVVLVALLVWSGVGSLAATRLPARLAGGAVLATALVIASLTLGLAPLAAEAFAALPLGARMTGVVLGLAPAGLAMGTCFPLAVSALAADEPRLVAPAFVWNGVASVLASPVAVLIALQVGFSGTLAAGVGCYLLAGVLLLAARRPAPAPASGPG